MSILKMALQHILLPGVYGFWRLMYRGRKKDRIIFADAHHDTLPFSMEVIHEELERRGYALTDVFRDYGNVSRLRAAMLAVGFMRLYARAEYVFICDNFLPVSSCRKSGDTVVVQLWHACGLLKRMGYDTAEDVPAGYRGHVYRNYDLVTVSSECCAEPIRNAMAQKRGVVLPMGVSRTDRYFDRAWVEACRAEFYAAYPQAKGKRIILWAPTFRGNAGDPVLTGMEEINALKASLGEGFFLIRKLHPHLERKYRLSDSAIPAERLLCAADLLITDYSSILFDFALLEKPWVLFTPDLEEYRRKRGFYVEYESLSPYVVTDPGELAQAVRKALSDGDRQWVREIRVRHADRCDGGATRRILEYLEL